MITYLQRPAAERDSLSKAATDTTKKATTEERDLTDTEQSSLKAWEERCAEIDRQLKDYGDQAESQRAYARLRDQISTPDAPTRPPVPASGPRLGRSVRGVRTVPRIPRFRVVRPGRRAVGNPRHRFGRHPGISHQSVFLLQGATDRNHAPSGRDRQYHGRGSSRSNGWNGYRPRYRPRRSSLKRPPSRNVGKLRISDCGLRPKNPKSAIRNCRLCRRHDRRKMRRLFRGPRRTTGSASRNRRGRPGRTCGRSRCCLRSSTAGGPSCGTTGSSA